MDGLLGILSDLSVGRESLLHDPADVGDREKPVLLANVGARALISAVVAASIWTRRSFGHCRENPSPKHQSQNDIVSRTRNPRERAREKERDCLSYVVNTCVCVREKER